MLKPIQNRQPQADQLRRTVIPAPRIDSMFPGWGVKF